MFLVGTTALSLLAAVPGIAQTASLPNIVLIVADDHGKDAIGAYGNPIVRTPAIDALARDGIRFNRAFATVSSCSPSRASLLTGKPTHSMGMYGLQQVVHHFSTFDETDSLPLALARQGYRTARVGKYHVAPEGVFHFEKDLGEGKKAVIGTFGRSPVEMAEAARDFIDADKPFFLYYATNDPHRAAPHTGVNSFGNIPGGYEGAPPEEYDPSKVLVPDFLPDLPETRAEIAQYYQSVSRVDRGVERLVQILKATGKYDNTLILYLSDNGVAFPGAKATLYEPGICLPLIIKAPQAKPAYQGTATDALVSWVDLFPTLLDYAGKTENSEDDFKGRSFRALLDGRGYSPRRKIYASQTFHEIQMYYPMRVVRTERFKLIWNLAYPLDVRQAVDLKNSATWKAAVKSPGDLYGQRPLSKLLRRPEFELYDLQKDPAETSNLATQVAHSKLLDSLKVDLLAYLDATNDPWSPNWQGKGE